MSQKSMLIAGALVACLGLSYAVTPAYALDEASDPVITNEIDEPTGPSVDNGEVVTPSKDEAPVGSDDDTVAGDSAEETEETGDPEMWPMYVSLGALGGALVLIIIINLALGHKQK